ncbi:hypothetical protein BDA99DRAFT_525472 [Phascolomyces articulosus]|uniref:Uncharacterized protein n=1 Tax=Phascolomyces articulosus TaxID=60185 RepID=A0AAD5PA41_9FUNG|nr:hypothetical protein BDA99DRAFT_525472 [Phascolomyces articulosus]
MVYCQATLLFFVIKYMMIKNISGNISTLSFICCVAIYIVILKSGYLIFKFIGFFFPSPFASRQIIFKALQGIELKHVVHWNFYYYLLLLIKLYQE